MSSVQNTNPLPDETTHFVSSLMPCGKDEINLQQEIKISKKEMLHPPADILELAK